MSLNCWTCPVLQRTNSKNNADLGKEKGISRFFCVKISRSWSGNTSPQPYEQIGKEPSNSGSPRRLNMFDNTSYGTMRFEANIGDEPRLVRSSGMRRDWSFENLRGQRVEKKGGNM
ncbi:hypothetical protein like AT5G46770 [Hibiscus trionum]|uniref:Uncharacterized protein n=1 Tax=Hibiscus trionum TaxID=183268 RepID=A0A9W7H6V5_HIBTR|nr:hypothetical protein like AT5G46770 [Hibiscus trionum]